MKIAVIGGTPVDSRLGYVVENKFFYGVNFVYFVILRLKKIVEIPV